MPATPETTIPAVKGNLKRIDSAEAETATEAVGVIVVTRTGTDRERTMTGSRTERRRVQSLSWNWSSRRHRWWIKGRIMSFKNFQRHNNSEMVRVLGVDRLEDFLVGVRLKILALEIIVLLEDHRVPGTITINLYCRFWWLCQLRIYFDTSKRFLRHWVVS